MLAEGALDDQLLRHEIGVTCRLRLRVCDTSPPSGGAAEPYPPTPRTEVRAELRTRRASSREDLPTHVDRPVLLASLEQGGGDNRLPLRATFSSGLALRRPR